MKNRRLLDALNLKKVDSTPIWIMRQAGRYLPEYRKVRKSVSGFMELCKTPELACEVTLQPLRRFDLDAAILFSDILTVPEAMGLNLSFLEGEGPVFSQSISDKVDIENLITPDPYMELEYVMSAIKLIRRELDNKVPLIGFAGSPWTIATYMIEGKGSKQFTKTRKMLYSNPSLLHSLLHKITEVTKLYLEAQISSGVNAIQIFDSWGGILSPVAFEEFSLTYMQEIIQYINSKSSVPIIVFTKGGGLWLDKIKDIKPHCIGLDWNISTQKARATLGENICLQGNLDPAVLYGNQAKIEQHVQQVMKGFSSKGHIFNLGHGIYPDIHPEKVSMMIAAVRNFSK